MNKQLLITIVLTTLITGLIGFYSGRYYERKIFRKNFQTRVDSGTFGDRNRIDRPYRQNGDFHPTPPQQ